MIEKMARKNPTDEELADLDPGDEVTASFSEQRFSPVQYQTFGVGPFFCKVHVRPGESGADAFSRAYQACRAIAKRAYPEARDDFLGDVKDATDAARANAKARR